MSNSKTLYVFGDAGEDEFVLEGGEKQPFGSGAFFVSNVLEELLPNWKVQNLVEFQQRAASKRLGQGKASTAVTMPPLTRMQAVIKKYTGTCRVERYRLAPPEAKPKVVEVRSFQQTRHPDDTLVLHHAGSLWKKQAYDACKPLVERFLNQQGSSSHRAFPRILVNVSLGLPEEQPDPTPTDHHFKSPLWELLREHAPQIGIVTSASTLRQAGAVIGRRLSIEHLVEDLCTELNRFPSFESLGAFSHLFIRVGMIAVVHLYHEEDFRKNKRFVGHVFFSPYAANGVYRDQQRDGGTLGRNVVLLGALLKGAETTTPDTPWLKRRHLIFRQALTAMQRMDDHGYHFEGKGSGASVITNAASVAKTVFEGRPEPGASRHIGWRKIPEDVLLPVVTQVRRRWHILDDMLLQAPAHRINIALAIVFAGYDKVLNRTWIQERDKSSRVFQILARPEYWNPDDYAPDFVTLEGGQYPAMPPRPETETKTAPIIGPIDKPFDLCVPVQQFGKLNLIERDEIESLRSIANLIHRHRLRVHEDIAKKEKTKPVSIAVFGPPGSGKSFAVKQLVKVVGNPEELPILEFNVTQMKQVSDIEEALKAVAKKKTVGNTVVTPLVFFDEFDSAFDNEPLGWLKYFLGPMQDGAMRDVETGPAIFVFAGGVFQTFSRFDPRTDTAYDNLRDSDEYRARLAQFTNQKGPDFISRLRGHIDILPINESPGRPKHFIRRAMQLRSLLDMYGHIDDASKEARISSAVVYALLTVDRFRHGVRSMEAILAMCAPLYGKIEISSLPSRTQLDMHVDAEEFMIRVHRGRARKKYTAAGK